MRHDVPTAASVKASDELPWPEHVTVPEQSNPVKLLDGGWAGVSLVDGDGDGVSVPPPSFDEELPEEGPLDEESAEDDPLDEELPSGDSRSDGALSSVIGETSSDPVPPVHPTTNAEKAPASNTFVRMVVTDLGIFFMAGNRWPRCC
jgi:hypothetical protein